ncbi:MAG: hypothetical protein U9N13_06925 [Euryarchaeota archaeon]|nr:hypothetical protein [Euryarchaeota archaeon]
MNVGTTGTYYEKYSTYPLLYSRPPPRWRGGEGHYIAAGPTIPTSAKEEFIQKLDAVIDRQIGSMNISDSQKKKKKKKKNA